MFRTVCICAALIAACAQSPGRSAWVAPGVLDAPFALVKDIGTAPLPAYGMNGDAMFATLGNAILFSAYTRQAGTELRRTDGTEAGTQMVKDTPVGEDASIGYYGSQPLLQMTS